MVIWSSALVVTLNPEELGEIQSRGGGWRDENGTWGGGGGGGVWGGGGGGVVGGGGGGWGGWDPQNKTPQIYILYNLFSSRGKSHLKRMVMMHKRGLFPCVSCWVGGEFMRWCLPCCRQVPRPLVVIISGGRSSHRKVAQLLH